MSLVELAETVYAEYTDASQEESDQRFEEASENFITAARLTAKTRFGDAADALNWTYTLPDDLPQGIEEAVAALAPGRPEYLRYRYDHDGENPSFELVQPCSACGHERINEVTGLTKLGELLAAKGGDR
jgi:hypothetical protein